MHQIWYRVGFADVITRAKLFGDRLSGEEGGVDSVGLGGKSPIPIDKASCRSSRL